MEVQSDATTIEMTYNGQTKSAQLANSLEDHWNSLETQFREQFTITEDGAQPKAKYVDEEGDRVSIDSNEELRDLMAQGKPLQLEFSLDGKRGKGRCISCEERIRRREERMMKKFGKVLSKEEMIQLRQERRKERMMKKFGKVLTQEEIIQLREERKKERMMKKEERMAKQAERKKLQQERRNANMIKKFGKILTEEELTQKREEMRNQRMLKRIGKPTLSEEERVQLRQERMKQRIERKAARKRCIEEIVNDDDKDDSKKEKEVEEGGSSKPARLSREERRQLNQQRKKQRLEERQARKEAKKNAADDDDDDLIEWPADATHLYLDGNNMMFLTAQLRNLTLKGGKRHEAEALLAAAAKSFILAQPEGSKMQHAVLIFDSTRTNEIAKIGSNQISFRICSARPQLPTSDDALIAWAKEGKDQGISSGMIFVTSDRALRDQLKEAGGRLMKPKQFLRLARRLSIALAGTPSAVAEDNNNNAEKEGQDGGLDAWLSSLNI